MKYAVGSHLRAFREQKQETLKDVAKRASISESLLSQIERNKISPALETLFKITDALAIEPDVLFADMSKERHIQIVKKSQRKKISKKGIHYTMLSRTVNPNSRYELESFMIELAPGKSQDSLKSTHPGQECGFIMKGKAELQFGESLYKLEEGDSISFSSTVPHAIKNVGEESLVAYWVTSPPRNLV